VNTVQAKPIATAYVDDRAVNCQPLKMGMSEFDSALKNIDNLCKH